MPIPKGKNINLTDYNNYRGIALGSLLGKVFDLIWLERYSDFLATSELQFGFKACEDPIFGASCIRCDAKFGNHVVYVAWLVENQFGADLARGRSGVGHHKTVDDC